MRIFTRKVPVYFVLIFFGATLILAYLLFGKKANLPTAANSSDAQTAQTQPCTFNVRRLGGFNFIRPVLFVETGCKSPVYESLRQSVTSFIEEQKLAGNIDNASFYFRDIEKTEWTGYNEDERFNPGSLLKVPELIAYLRLEEDKPGTLNKEYFYAAPFTVEKDPLHISKKLQPGKKYSVRELLRYMISYSDNNATILLDQHLDQYYFNKILSDFNLPAIDPKATNYPVTAKSYSLFFQSILNASYLTIPNSEYAAELLSTCDFKAGFMKGLPPSTKLMHKFGEAGNQSVRQLHESGIFFFNDKPFLLTVMTSGKDPKNLAPVISTISGMVNNMVSVP